MLSKLPMTSLRWRVKRTSTKDGDYIRGVPMNIKQRNWVDITSSAEEECIIQVEITRKCLYAGKVSFNFKMVSVKECLHFSQHRLALKHIVHILLKLRMKDGGWC